ncbi:MAG: thioredoxin family protein [Bacteroidia bacterium]|nr:thioredoxin family protein [Bacteroidia bacterium]
MIRNIVIGIIVFTLFGCKNYYLRGYFTVSEFKEQCRWKNPVNTRYTPKKRNLVYLDSLQTTKDSVDLKLFLGTWCSDSRKLVPKFFNIMPKLPIRSVTIVSVDTTKRDINRWVNSYQVDSIPMFIFFRNEKEIGRIKVKPGKQGLEPALWHIISPKDSMNMGKKEKNK